VNIPKSLWEKVLKSVTGRVIKRVKLIPKTLKVVIIVALFHRFLILHS